MNDLAWEGRGNNETRGDKKAVGWAEMWLTRCFLAGTAGVTLAN